MLYVNKNHWEIYLSQIYSVFARYLISWLFQYIFLVFSYSTHKYHIVRIEYWHNNDDHEQYIVSRKVRDEMVFYIFT